MLEEVLVAVLVAVLVLLLVLAGVSWYRYSYQCGYRSYLEYRLGIWSFIWYWNTYW